MAKKSSLISTKKNISKLLVFIVIFIIGYYIFQFGKNYIQELFKPNNYTPVSIFLDINKKFDDLKLPDFDENLILSDNPNLEFTLDKSFPNFSDRVFVYQINNYRETHLTVDNSLEVASILDFKNEPNYETSQITWTTQKKTFTLQRPILKWIIVSNPTIYKFHENAEYRDLTKSIDAKSNALLSLDLPVENFDLSTPKHYPVTYDDSHNFPFQIVNDPEASQYLFTYSHQEKAIPFISEDTEAEYKKQYLIETNSHFYSEHPYLSRLYAVFEITQSQLEGLRHMYLYPFKISSDPGVYPIISPEKAYAILQEGNASLRSLTVDNDFFADYQTKNVSEFRIDASKTELAYLIKDEITDTSYTYPIYIFRGETIYTNGELGNFIFYVDALDGSK